METKPRIYIAGPMRGYADFNFAAFDLAARALSQHWHVINPADIDRELDNPPQNDIEATERVREFAARDCSEIVACDAMAMLPGWRDSKGAQAEYHLACWLEIPVWEYRDRELVELEKPEPLPAPARRRADILAAARKCVCADRQSTYGDAEDNFQDIATLWNVVLGAKLRRPLARADVATACACIKLARIKTSPHHLDNWIDLAGYAACGGGIVKATQEG